MSDDTTLPTEPETNATEEPKAKRGRKAKLPDQPPGTRIVYVQANATPPNRPMSVPDEYEPYWLGSLDGGPLNSYKFGGHAFPRNTKPIIADGLEIGPLKYSERCGAIAWLDPQQVEDIKNDVKRFIIRRQGPEPRQGRLHCTEEWALDNVPGRAGTRVNANGASAQPQMVNRYRKTSRDYPAGAHVYLMPWAERAEFVGYDEKLVKAPRTLADELELPVPAWVYGEPERLRAQQVLAEARNPVNFESGPTLAEAEAFMKARQRV